MDKILLGHGSGGKLMHELIREHSLLAWAEVAAGRPNPLPARLSADERITHFLEPARVLALLDAGQYVGDAPERASRVAAEIRGAVDS